MMHHDLSGLGCPRRRCPQAYNAGLRRILLVQAGAEHDMPRPSRPSRVRLAPAGLALLGHEHSVAGVNAAARWRRRPPRSSGAVRAGTKPGRSGGSSCGVRGRRSRQVCGARRDTLMMGVAVPTIAFASSPTSRRRRGPGGSLAPAYGDDWWYAGMLAFVRQEQERWAEAAALADRALAAAGFRSCGARPRSRPLRDR